VTPERVQVLSLGEMADVERQLEPTFAVHRATGADIDPLVARHGPAIRAVATRGRDRLDARLLTRLPALEIIANFGVGYDSIDVDAAARRGIVVTNTPEVLNDEVADFAVALLLATVRRLPQADRFVRAGQWLQGNFPLGPTLRDRTIGLVGMGRIGKRIAQRLAAFEVPIVYHSRTARTDVPYRHYRELVAMAKDVNGAAFAPSFSARGGAFLVYANGGEKMFQGECQGAFQAVAASGSNNPLTIVESNT